MLYKYILVYFFNYLRVLYVANAMHFTLNQAIQLGKTKFLNMYKHVKFGNVPEGHLSLLSYEITS